MKFINRLIAAVALTSVMAPPAVAATSGDVPQLIGFMVYSDEWLDLADQAYNQYGYYSFRPDGSEPFKAISPIAHDNSWAAHGGTYANGLYYGYDVNGTYMQYTLTYRVLDPTTWRVTNSATYTYKMASSTSEESQKARLVPSDMAYDPIGDVIYASTRRFQGDSECTLCRVNRQTGELERLGSIPNLCALTADAEGNLMGIAVEDGALYSIAKDGKSAKIGETGFYPSRESEIMQSATYDYVSGKIYWSMFGFATGNDRNYNINGVFAMIEVDPATGAGALTWTYPRDQRFSSLSILSAHPYAPADITDLQFMPAASESNDAVLTFTVPSLTAAQRPIEGDLTVTCILDQEEYAVERYAPGTSYRKEIAALESGNHSVTVVVSNGSYSGNPVYATTFFGIDVPERVGNLKLAAGSDATEAVLTWDAPVYGISGSEVDQSKIRYRVVRQPGDVTVARSLSACSLTETIRSTYGPVYYTVTPYHVDRTADLGRARNSNTVMLGTDIEPPYLETFGSQTAYDTYSTIDVDCDGDPNVWDSPCWKYDTEYLCAFYCGTRSANANDWLITPPFAFDSNKLYKLTFKHYAYYGYGTLLNVSIGSEATAEAIDARHLLEISRITTFYDRPGVTEEVVFAPRPGERFIGFHHLSANMEHLSIDDVEITEAGDSRVPAAIADLSGFGVGDEVFIGLTAPYLTAASNPLECTMTIEIYRDINQKPVATIGNVAPRQHVEWTDEDAVRGLNDYVVLASNSYGRGLQAELSVDLSPVLPESVTNARARYINDRQVEITWEPSATAADPSKLVRYQVHRIVSDNDGVMDYPVIGRDLTDTRFIDDDPCYGMETGSQQFVQYYVSPVNGAGLGVAAPTTGVLVGDAYTLPFTETWANGGESTGPWTRSASGASWYVHAWAYDPSAQIPQGMGILDCEVDGFNDVGVGYVFTPRIDLSGGVNPKLTLSMWTDPVYASDARLMVGVQTDGSDDFEYITSTVAMAHSDTKEWRDFTFDLSAYAGCQRASIVLVGYTYAEQRLHITNFRVTCDESRPYVSGAYIVGASDLRENQTAEYTAYVSNASPAEVRNVVVEITADGAPVATSTVSSIAPNTRGEVRFNFTAAREHVGAATLAVSVKAGSGYSAVEAPATKEVRVKPANYPAVADLSAAEAGGSVLLSWSLPTTTGQSLQEIEGFEAYDTFTIDAIGGWTTYDGDGYVPFRLNGSNGLLEWPNCDEPQAFTIFDPQKVADNSPFLPYAGNQMAMCFGSPYGANNDWLISPELSGEAQLVTLYVAAMRGAEAENFHFLISRTDNNPESFVRLNGKSPIAAPGGWELMFFALPEGTRYFAINYVGESNDGLMIDDICMISNHNALVADGYNIYRDGVRLNDNPVASRQYIDTGVDRQDSHTYTVRPVFDGCEGDDSNQCVVDVSSVNEIGAGTGVSIRADGGAIIIEGAETEIAIFTVDGRLIGRLAPADIRSVYVTAGVYLVSTGRITAKVVVK